MRGHGALRLLLLPQHTPLGAPGLYIQTLLPGSPAASDGRLSLGDRILEVNGSSLLGVGYLRYPCPPTSAGGPGPPSLQAWLLRTPRAGPALRRLGGARRPACLPAAPSSLPSHPPCKTLAPLGGSGLGSEGTGSTILKLGHSTGDLTIHSG